MNYFIWIIIGMSTQNKFQFCYLGLNWTLWTLDQDAQTCMSIANMKLG
jgi:hypothetical protein